MFFLNLAFALHLAGAADVSELSPKCADLAGDFRLNFHGEIGPFRARKHEVRLTFLEGASGVRLATKYPFRTLQINLDTDTLLSTYQLDWSLRGTVVADCYSQPYECLKASDVALKDLDVARTYPAEALTPENKRALHCAIERVRLFAKTVRTEVLQPTLRALPRF